MTARGFYLHFLWFLWRAPLSGEAGGRATTWWVVASRWLCQEQIQGLSSHSMRRTTPIVSWDKDHSAPLRCGSSVLLPFWGHFFNRFYYILHVSCVSVCVCYTQTTTTNNTNTDTCGEFFMGCKGCMVYNNYLFIFSFILSSQSRSFLMLYHNSKAVFYRTTNTEISMLLFPSHPVSILCHSYSWFFIISILSLSFYFSLSLSLPRLFYNIFCFITARLSSAVFIPRHFVFLGFTAPFKT